MSPLPFFCAVCDKPIQQSQNRKHDLIHDKCMEEYLSKFKIANKRQYIESTTTNKQKK